MINYFFHPLITMKLRLLIDNNPNQEMILCIKKIENAEMAFSFCEKYNAKHIILKV